MIYAKSITMKLWACVCYFMINLVCVFNVFDLILVV
ncbi:hypothetical protein AALP_AA8G275900 [Arabis alpina]|uniref:Uncharacterized protein n=1 Tax=Arabis alpina TaxID=50452 RepID=A0A087G9V0_ARAAL|nr:hypothetical protein AALP_AA8G275900 [Arabis alpina]